MSAKFFAKLLAKQVSFGFLLTADRDVPVALTLRAQRLVLLDYSMCRKSNNKPCFLQQGRLTSSMDTYIKNITVYNFFKQVLES